MTDWHILSVGLLRLSDVALCAVLAFGLFWFKNGTWDMPAYYQWAIVLAVLLLLNFSELAGLYRPEAMTSTSIQVVRFFMAWTGVFAVLLALAYLTNIPDWFNIDWAVMWYGLTLVGVLASRLIAWLRRRRLRTQGRLQIRVALVGARELGRKVLKQIAADDQVEVIGVFDDIAPPEALIEGIPYRGGVSDLVAYSRRHPLDEIILAMVDRSEEEIEAVLQKLREVPVNAKFCAHTLRFNLPVRGYSALGGLPLLHVYEKPMAGWGAIWKSAEDRILGFLMLLMLLPIMAVIAVLIKLDSPGPVLFRQKRYGFNNNEIDVFKFRSMRHDTNPDPSVPQARKNDPRITRIGAFLRKSSLDELPQLFNVLAGTMSLVGPRPHAVAHNEHYAQIIDGYLGRHRVKPGITGWAQVNGYRGETDTPEKMRMRVQYDVYYIDNWSVSFDLKILLMTVFVGFVHRNAY
jgi:putative colanic acid biosynthesis UDP-glucose lipid carrier transferase